MRTIIIINMRFGNTLIPAVALSLVVSACSAGTVEDSTVHIVATTTILGDVVANVVGDGAVVEVLVPIGADPHDFRVSARQIASMESADLIIANGLNLEQSLDDLLASLEADGTPVLRLGETLDPLPFGDSGGASGLDPHVWMDPLRMAIGAGNIADALLALGIDGPWPENAASYAGELTVLDSEIRNTLGIVPTRVLVTNHDSMGYFAARYDFEVVGVVIPGGSTLAAPSSSELAALVEVVRSQGVPAIFSETTEPDDLAAAVASEGDLSVIELFIGSLGGPGSGAETYIDLMRSDAALIAQGLG